MGGEESNNIGPMLAITKRREDVGGVHTAERLEEPSKDFRSEAGVFRLASFAGAQAGTLEARSPAAPRRMRR
ncbi:hypothetical protein ACC733_38560, partial [Rhizobium johnstonii]|uniref:hypothetical protein n=1 Tax=Rhizobium johnstonii TaxID=3019933 RepID=UPI003F96022C